MLIMIHVDDGAISTSHKELADELIAFLQQTVKIRDYEVMTGMLGMEITQTEDGIRVSANRLIRKSLSELLLDPDHVENTPLKFDIHEDDLDLIDEAKHPDQAKHVVNLIRKRIGTALYISRVAIPELPILSQRWQSSRANHQTLQATNQICQYLKKVLEDDQAIVFHRSVPGERLRLQVYTDATWGDDVKNRHSHTGILIYLAGGVIHSISKQQTPVALSSTEAEIYAIATAVSTTRHLMELLDHMQHIYALQDAGENPD